MRQQTVAFTGSRASRLASAGHRIGRVRFAHRSESKQASDRRQAVVDRCCRVAIQPLPRQRHHIATRPPRHRRLPTRAQEPQQRLGINRLQCDVLSDEPATKRQQVETVRAHRARRIVPTSQIAEVVVHQPELPDARTVQPPRPARRLQPQLDSARHKRHTYRPCPPEASNPATPRVESTSRNHHRLAGPQAVTDGAHRRDQAGFLGTSGKRP